MLKITGETLVFKNVKEDGKVTYRTSIGHKEADGSYKNAGIMVRFPKGVELDDRTKIEIKDAKLDHFEVEDGRPVFYVFVFEHEIIQE